MLDDGWKARYLANVESKQAEVGETISQHLESLYPVADMAILRRYGCVRDLKDATIHVYNPETERWDQWFSIALPRTVETPNGYQTISCGGPRWSRNPGRGVNPETKAKMIAASEWEKFCSDQDKKEREQLPESLEPFFLMLVKERNQYKRDYRDCVGWPAKYRQERGKYPTWGEIVAEFSVLAGAE